MTIWSQMNPIPGTIAKFNRAVEQLEGLQALLKEFVEGQPGSIEWTYDELTSEIVGTIHFNQDPPLKASAIVGEIAYDFRSILDHFVYALTVTEQGHPLARTEFPIFKDRTLYYGTDNRANPSRGSGLDKIRGITDPVVRQIVDEFQPFHETERSRKPEDHYLWALHEVNNADKHRRLHLCCCTFKSVAVFPGPSMVGPNTGLKFIEPVKLKGNREIIRWIGPPSRPATIDIDSELSVSVGFDEPSLPAIDGRPLLDTLNAFGQVVQAVGQRLQGFFP